MRGYSSNGAKLVLRVRGRSGPASRRAELARLRGPSERAEGRSPKPWRCRRAVRTPIPAHSSGLAVGVRASAFCGHPGEDGEWHETSSSATTGRGLFFAGLGRGRLRRERTENPDRPRRSRRAIEVRPPFLGSVRHGPSVFRVAKANPSRCDRVSAVIGRPSSIRHFAASIRSSAHRAS